MNSDARGIRAKTLSVIVPTYREAANVPRVVRAFDGGARGPAVGNDRRRRRFARRHRGRRLRHRRLRPAPALSQARQSRRSGRRRHRGLARLQRRSRRGHRRRSPARRNDPAENVRGPRLQRRRSGDRHARRRRDRSRRSLARASEAQRSRRLVLSPHRGDRDFRPDERLLHDAPRDRRRASRRACRPMASRFSSISCFPPIGR